MSRRTLAGSTRCERRPRHRRRLPSRSCGCSGSGRSGSRRSRPASPRLPTGTSVLRRMLLEQMGWREPAVWRIEGDAVEAALGVGDQERAAVLVDRFEQQAQHSGIPWSLAVSARCRGLLLAAQGQLDASAEALERALGEHERSPVPFERARTLLAYGQVLRRAQAETESPGGARGGGRALRAAGRRVVGRADARGAAAHRRARGADRPERDRAEDRQARRRRPHQPRDRRRGVRQPEDGRGESRTRLSQAGDPLPRPARTRARGGGTPADFVGVSPFRRERRGLLASKPWWKRRPSAS